MCMELATEMSRPDATTNIGPSLRIKRFCILSAGEAVSEHNGSPNCLVCGLSPSMNIFNWIGLENPWVEVLLSKSLNLSNVSL